jgi:tetratricopeptide (TPR) repeat protein
MPNALATVALLASLTASPSHPAKAPPSGIVFIDDDYAGALAKAKAEQKPLFLDSWATWCHSCLSMKAFVFPDAGLRAAKDAVVWLAIETETEKNRPVTEKYPVDGLPTFLIIDPITEQVIGKWLGTSSVNEMRQFVVDTVAAWQTTRKGGKLSPATEAEREGHTAEQAGDRQAAAKAYRRALQLTDAKDPRRPERVALLVSALGGLGTPEAAKECVQLASQELNKMPSSPPGADFSINAADCAAEQKSDPQAQALLTAALARMEKLAGDSRSALSVDDRSDLYAHLADHLDALKRHDEAVAAMRKRSAMLEAAAKAAPDAVTAATFDAHRTDTYLYLGEAPKAEAMLSAREKDIPTDYNPPARLARVLLEEKRPAEAEAAVNRALAKMPQGPRKVGILGLKARILAAQGKDKTPVLREQLALIDTLPKTAGLENTRNRVEAELKAAAEQPHAKR